VILYKTIHKDYIRGWANYQKTSSYRNGARWNSKNTPAMYLSANPQNAMLEIANYAVSPKIANTLYRIVVFEFPELRLLAVTPSQLPKQWNDAAHSTVTQQAGDAWLTSGRHDAFIAPSVTINHVIATHAINAVRDSVYANVIVNLGTVGTANIRMVGSYKPVFSDRMFTP
jgi:RES domain-containing protein